MNEPFVFLFLSEGDRIPEKGVTYSPGITEEIREVGARSYIYPSHWPFGKTLYQLLDLIESPFVVIVDKGAFPLPTRIERTLTRVHLPFGMLYGDHLQGGRRVKSFEDPGDITGRFPYGPCRVYPSHVLKGYRHLFPDLRYAVEYSLWFQFREIGLPTQYVDEAFSQIEERKTRKELESFRYLFLSAEEEREKEKVFKDMLMRKGAFLSGPIMSYPFETVSSSPLVSVVIPVRNRVKTIEEGVLSVLYQGFQDFELIVADTGSTDGTREKVEKLAQHDGRIRLLPLEGGQISHALNRAIGVARGEFIARLDSDDLYLSDTLQETVTSLLRNPGAALAVSYYEVIDEEGHPIPEIPVVRHLEFDRNNLLRSEGVGAVRVWRKKALQYLGGFNERDFSSFGEDYDMALRVSERWEIVKVHKVLYRYRRHPESADLTTEREKKIELKTLSRQRALRRRIRFNQILRLSLALER